SELSVIARACVTAFSNASPRARLPITNDPTTPINSRIARPVRTVLAIPLAFFVTATMALLARSVWSPWGGYRQDVPEDPVVFGGEAVSPMPCRSAYTVPGERRPQHAPWRSATPSRR